MDKKMSELIIYLKSLTAINNWQIYIEDASFTKSALWKGEIFTENGDIWNSTHQPAKFNIDESWSFPLSFKITTYNNYIDANGGVRGDIVDIVQSLYPEDDFYKEIYIPNTGMFIFNLDTLTLREETAKEALILTAIFASTIFLIFESAKIKEFIEGHAFEAKDFLRKKKEYLESI